MKKILLIFLLFSKISFGKQSTEFEMGLQASRSHYHIKTAGNSVLKWRDVELIGPAISFKHKLAKDFNLKANASYQMIYSGVMTDDDLQNSTCPSGGKNCKATFSRTKKMRGSEIEFDLLLYNKISNIDFIIGGFYKSYDYKPSGLHQVQNQEGVFNNKDGEFQHSLLTIYGPAIGFAFNKNSKFHNFQIELLGFLSLITKSQKDHWGGYSWHIKDNTGKTFGFDLKISTNFHTSKNMWVNFYTKVSYIKGNDLTEYGTATNSNKSLGGIDYLTHTKLSIGASFKYK